MKVFHGSQKALFLGRQRPCPMGPSHPQSSWALAHHGFSQVLHTPCATLGPHCLPKEKLPQYTLSPSQPSHAHPCGPGAAMRPGPWMSSETFIEHLLYTGYKDKQIGNAVQRERPPKHTRACAVLKAGWSTATLLAASPVAPKRLCPHPFSSPPRFCAAHHLIPALPAILTSWTERIQVKPLCCHVAFTKFLSLSQPQFLTCKNGDNDSGHLQLCED